MSGERMAKHYVRSQYGNQTKKDREDHQDIGELIESRKTSSSWE